jgi:hypothetical protein
VTAWLSINNLTGFSPGLGIMIGYVQDARLRALTSGPSAPNSR